MYVCIVYCLGRTHRMHQLTHDERRPTSKADHLAVAELEPPPEEKRHAVQLRLASLVIVVARHQARCRGPTRPEEGEQTADVARLAPVVSHGFL